MATPNKFLKQPTEDYDVTLQFTTAKLPSGRAISSVNVTVEDDANAATTEVLGNNTATVSSNDITWNPKGGVSGKWYRFDLTITLDDASILEENVWMIVEDKKSIS